MSIVLVVVLLVALAVLSFSIVSYPILKWCGVEDDLQKRSLKFGSTILLIGSIAQAILTVIVGEVVASIGSLIIIYMYISGVLDISTFRKVSLTILIPIVGALPLAILLTVYNNYA